MKKTKRATIKFIYNPNAGSKKGVFRDAVSLNTIKALLKQYELVVDYAPTKYAGHAQKLALESVKEGYTTVLVAGGDGTVSEAANGLVNSDVRLGLLPMGTFMNIAHMLAVPTDIENAIRTIKIGRTRKIDVAEVIGLEGDKPKNEAHYFLETAGVGMDAEVQADFKQFEKGNILALPRIIKRFMERYETRITLSYDDTETDVKAPLISIANGPYTGAHLRLAPRAKLNDHLLTITIYSMSKFELLRYFFNMKFVNKIDMRKLHTIQSKQVRVTSNKPVPMHADATVFGMTPATVRIIPNAITVICGFSPSGEPDSLQPRTFISP